MGFLDKAMAAAEQAATKAKEGVEDVQVKRELSQANGELGRVAYELAESGEISHQIDYTAADELPIFTQNGTGGSTGLGNIRDPLSVVNLLPGATQQSDLVLRITQRDMVSETFGQPKKA